MHYSHILGLSATDTRVIETHAKPRESVRQRRLPPLCPSSMRTGNNAERRSMDMTRDALQSHLRSICY